MSGMKDIIVGIDLGTTNSLVAICDEAGPRVLRDANGDALVPSFLCFSPDGRVIVGHEAKAHAVEFPTSTIFSIKRMMGQGFEELEAHEELAKLPYHVVKRQADASGRDVPAVEIEGRLLTPPELSALILRELKQRATERLDCEVRKAVITVPAYFDDAQRQATRDAGRIAGLDVVRIVNEPTAAALAYGLGVRGQLEAVSMEPGPASSLNLAGKCASSPEAHHAPGRKNDVDDGDVIAVYDLGGGTFDVSLLRMSDGVFEVLSTHGNTRLGGDDFDREIIQLVQREVEEQFGLQIESPATRQALRSLAESVKIRLSADHAADIEIDLGERRVYRRRITRDELDAMLSPWVEKTLESCRRAMADAKVAPEQVNQVILVGGCTRIPLVRTRVREVFGREPYTAINPDEVVALGAAVQAAILSGVRRDALLLDVIPLSLGIETLGGAMGKLILRNTRIPCQATEQFSTFVDGQTNVKINVLQGERELAKDCRSLGEFELRGIPPMPAGLPKLMVTFLIDENGILNVSAREERSGKEAGIQIVPTHGLTADEVKRMELESYAHAREDMTAHRLIDLRNQIAFDTAKTEQALARVADRLGLVERMELKESIAALRALGDSETDADRLHQALIEFDRSTVRLAELAITVALQEDQNVQASTTRRG